MRPGRKPGLCGDHYGAGPGQTSKELLMVLPDQSGPHGCDEDRGKKRPAGGSERNENGEEQHPGERCERHPTISVRGKTTATGGGVTFGTASELQREVEVAMREVLGAKTSLGAGRLPTEPVEVDALPLRGHGDVDPRGVTTPATVVSEVIRGLELGPVGS